MASSADASRRADTGLILLKKVALRRPATVQHHRSPHSGALRFWPV